MKRKKASHLAEDSESFLRDMVSKAMENYEMRPSQIDMMRACAENIEHGGILLAEAGTGTGKTFAYLIPVILSGRKTILSTKTINLQEQLVEKDLKFLSGLKGFSYAIAKGRSNYLCLRRLNALRHDDSYEAEEYRSFVVWASDTETGDIETFKGRRTSLWDRICADPDACRGNKCRYYRQCFYFRARQKWGKVQIVVANHALTGINCMLAGDARILPGAEVMILDEAHALDNVLSEVIGSTLSNRGFDSVLNRLLKTDERGHYRGLLSKSPHLFSALESLRAEAGMFWTMLHSKYRNREMIEDVFKDSGMTIGIAAAIHSLIEDIRTSVSGLFEEDEETELIAALAKLSVFSYGLEEFTAGKEGVVRWVEIENGRTALRISPVYPREFVLTRIVPEYQSIILTSATLSVEGNFSCIAQVLGVENSEQLALPSPFDFKSQVAVVIREGVDLKERDGPEKLAEVIIDEASRRDGGILVLFTSRDIMKKTWKLCAEDLEQMGFNPMIQGELPNRVVLQTMRGSENSIVFGLDSFWEGVDVQGNSLKSLIITKLPFEVPTEPVVMARTAMIEKEGGNPFYEYSLPRAVLKFRQGFGRLIRAKTDRGRIIICDGRIETRAYGRIFKKVFSL